MIRTIIPALIFAILCFSLKAERAKFSHLTIKDGLSQSSVKAIFQDKQGYMWFGTADGLNKYDGHHFEHFHHHPDNISSISGNDISCIYQNPNDSLLWIGTRGAGLNLYNAERNNFHVFTSFSNGPNKLPSNIINDILATSQTLWIATRLGGLCYYNSMDSGFVSPAFNKDITFQTINCLEADQEGNLWLGTPSGLYKWRYANKFNQELPRKVNLPGYVQNIAVSALQFDLKGNLWIGTRRNGIFRIHPKMDDYEYFEPNHYRKLNSPVAVYDILERNNGEIWIGTASGLLKYLAETNSFEMFNEQVSNPESLNNSVIYKLAEDRSGILWIGTYLGGINKMDPLESRFPKYDNFSGNMKRGRKSKDIRSVYVDKSKAVWLGTSNGLVEFYPSEFHSEVPETKTQIHLSGTRIGNVISYGDKLIISSSDGILEKTENGNFVSLSSKIKSQTGETINGFSASLVDEYQQLWLCSTQGLLKYSPADKEFEILNPESLKGTTSTLSFLTISEDNKGKLWLGTIDGKLFIFDKFSNAFTEIITDKRSNHKAYFTRVFSVNAHIPNEIWIGTNLGLYQYIPQTNKLNRFLTDDGLANNVVYGVLTQNKENIWCTTNFGLSHLETKTSTFKNYTYQEGLQSNEFNQGAYCTDEDGYIYIGGIDGLNIFDPDKIARNDYIPDVIINGLEIQYQKVNPKTHPRVLKRQISEAPSLNLSHKQNTFSFEFTALSYSHPERNQYQYALTKIGEKDKWIHSGNHRFATYTNIPPGEYIFSVKGSNSDGIFNNKPTSILIKIKPPFWQTWWFMLIIGILLLSATYLLLHLRIRRINKQKRIFKKLLKEKTKKLVYQTNKIERQNKELKAFNQNIINKTIRIEQNNELLNKQHIQITAQRDNLLKLAEKIENTNQSKFRFFTSVSHELRTPLTLLIGPLKELVANVEKTNKKEIARKLKNIYTSSSKLLLTLDHLLDFRKAETENLKLQVSHFNLVPHAQKCAFLFKELALSKNIDFQFTSEIIDLRIWADQNMLEKIIFNILANAFEATPRHGTVAVRITAEHEEDHTKAIIRIKDTGRGIEKSKIPLIFDRFHQINNANQSQISGSGLGLALVKSYVELHKGSILVNSNLGEGSEFTITLPTNIEHLQTEKADVSHPKKTNLELLKTSIGDYIPSANENTKLNNPQNKTSLLLLEPDMNLKNYLKEVLVDYFKIIEPNSASDGFQMAKSKKPAIIISDISLSGSDGFLFCKQIKEEFYTSHIPVIILTSQADNESHMKAIKSGADAYLTIPFDLQHLLLTIENLIEGRKILHRRFGLSNAKNIGEVITNSNDQVFIKTAMGYVNENLTNGAFSVEDLCTLLNLSQPQCYRKIKAITGYNISEFIRNTRLKKAAALLKNSDYKISEIAYKTGFNDPNYFTKSFVKLYGISPKEFAKSAQAAI